MIKGDRWYRARLNKGRDLRLYAGHRLPELEPWDHEPLTWEAAQIPAPVDVAEDVLERYAARMALEALPERERRIIELSFGFDEAPLTVAEIGVELDLTRERVKELRSKAMHRVAKYLDPTDDPTWRPRHLGLLCTRSSCWSPAVCRLTHVDASGRDVWRVATCDRCATAGMARIEIAEGRLVRKPLDAGKLHLTETPPSLLRWAKS